jgi:hypothetical protein
VEQSTLYFDERFLESYAGSIITDPATAIVELVANCWDAYATEVSITHTTIDQFQQVTLRALGEWLDAPSHQESASRIF